MAQNPPVEVHFGHAEGRAPPQCPQAAIGTDGRIWISRPSGAEVPKEDVCIFFSLIILNDRVEK